MTNMDHLKDFRHMTPQEKSQWLSEFSVWTVRDMPRLYDNGAVWNSALITAAQEGLHLMTAFTFCRDFVKNTLLFRDYPRRLQRMRHYVERIRKETEGLVTEETPRRRGRPTRAESVRMARERETQQALFAPGEKTVTQEKDTQEQDDKEGDSTLSDAVALSAASGVMLHLDQLSWLLSASLRERVGQVSSLRSLAAMESNQAKEMGIRGATATEIEPHARKAVEAVTSYKEIYAEVDRELGLLYATLFGDEPNTQALYNYGELCRRKGVEFSLLRKILKPYWEKTGCPVSSEPVMPEIPDEDPERKAERQARLHSIRTYFMRKDMAASLKRVSRMKELIEEVRSYGLPTDEYEVVLEKTEADLKDNGKETEEEDVH